MSTSPISPCRRTSTSPGRCSATRRSRPSCGASHAGVGVDQQNFWWHSAGSQPDGEISLNFGRLDDPAIDAGLDTARSADDPAVAAAAAEDVNRAFADGCYYIPLSWNMWGVVRDPEVQGVGTLVLPDGTPARDGAGFAGQYWIHSLFIDDT